MAGWELDLDGGGALQTELLGCLETLRHVRQEAKPESVRWRSLQTLASSGTRTGGTFLAGSSRRSCRSQTSFFLDISLDFNNAPFRLLCSRSVTLLGGGNNRRRMPSSRTSGMACVQKGIIAGVGSLFLNSFSIKRPDRRTVTQPILTGSDSRKTVSPGQHPGLPLMRVHSRKNLENF